MQQPRLKNMRVSCGCHKAQDETRIESTAGDVSISDIEAPLPVISALTNVSTMLRMLPFRSLESDQDEALGTSRISSIDSSSVNTSETTLPVPDIVDNSST
nr:unnamed protein product [Spirometra erinaceieuropaei]